MARRTRAPCAGACRMMLSRSLAGQRNSGRCTQAGGRQTDWFALSMWDAGTGCGSDVLQHGRESLQTRSEMRLRGWKFPRERNGRLGGFGELDFICCTICAKLTAILLRTQMWRRQLRGLSVILHPLRTTRQRVKTRLHLSERSAHRAILIFAPALASMMTGCVQYVHKPIDPAATLSAIEARSLGDAGLKRFLDLNHAAMGPDGNWNLRMLTLTAFYFRPELDE